MATLSRRQFLSLSAVAGGLVLAGLVPFGRKAFGQAHSVPALEYHGDSYDMTVSIPGYSMNPELFVSQMGWLADNQVHAVTGPELDAYLAGEIDLPSRSVILTTDSGATSDRSMPRMIPVMQNTGLHFHSYIWTMDMEPSHPTWDIFREALATGHFTFGCHTETHRDMATLSETEGMAEMALSKRKIEQALGIEINSISWPFESVPSWAPRLAEIGFEYAFAGNSRGSVSEAGVVKADPDVWSLPRVFPPGLEGWSGRPSVSTLAEIISLYSGASFE